MVFIVEKECNIYCWFFYLWILKCKFYFGAGGKFFYGMNVKLSVIGDCD